MIKDLEDLKEKILTLIKTDKEFAFELYRIIVREYGGELVTKTYLDEALAKQSEDLKREFYEALAKQNEEFDKKLAKQSEEFDRKLAKQSEEFDKKLAKQSEEFDKKLAKQSEDLKREFYNALAKQSEELKKEFYGALAKQSEELKKEFYGALAKQSEELKKYFTEQLDKKIGKLGQRWGINTETTIYNFAKDLVEEWGGSVEKWRKDIEVKMGNISYFRPFEVDIIISDGKVIAVEIKSSCGISEVVGFIEAIKMYEEEKGVKVDEKRIVTFFIYDDAKKFAEDNGIKIVSSEE